MAPNIYIFLDMQTYYFKSRTKKLKLGDLLGQALVNQVRARVNLNLLLLLVKPMVLTNS